MIIVKCVYAFDFYQFDLGEPEMDLGWIMLHYVERASYTNDFKRELKEKRPELTNKVPSELESFRRPKCCEDGSGNKKMSGFYFEMCVQLILKLSVFSLFVFSLKRKQYCR